GAVPAVAAGVVHAVEQAGVRHLVAREGNVAAPRILDARAREAGKHVDHSPAENPGGSPRRFGIGTPELRAAAEQQPAVVRNAEVIEKVLRVERHAPPWQERIGPAFVDRLGRGGGGANRNAPGPEAGGGAGGVARGRSKAVGGLPRAGG